MKYKKFINKIFILLSIITFIVLFIIIISKILQNNHEYEYNIDTETYDSTEEIYTITIEEMYINNEDQEPTETEVEQQENVLDDIDIYEISISRMYITKS